MKRHLPTYSSKFKKSPRKRESKRTLLQMVKKYPN